MNDADLKAKVNEFLSGIDSLEKDVSQITDDEDLYKDGMDSVSFIYLVYMIEQEYHVHLSDLDIVDKLSTKNGILDFLRSLQDGT